MSSFVAQRGSVARLGLTVYPNNATCGAPNAVTVTLPAPSATDDTVANQTKANDVNTAVQALTPVGGTPTGDALTFVGTLAGLKDATDRRDDFVLLLTDGLPNCNASNPNNQCTATNPACKCTTSTCTSALCAIGCLDQQGAINAVIALRGQGIRLFVLGFGADTAAGDGPAVLNAMAEAGGMSRTCPGGTNAECGVNNTCVQASMTCAKEFYSATNSAELQSSLADIINSIGP